MNTANKVNPLKRQWSPPYNWVSSDENPHVAEEIQFQNLLDIDKDNGMCDCAKP